ncbi:putative quinol monooxygenase [Nocardioides sp.]|uniref:putative quinol monooxygenase n=1 Tax=Nocardioides sp. TaxID=35761 RepID=UPI0035635EAA
MIGASRVSWSAEDDSRDSLAAHNVALASQSVEGVVSFDVGEDVTDPNSFVATEVFDDRAALDRQESLPEVAAAMAAFEDGLAAEPEATIFDVASSAPYE